MVNRITKIQVLHSKENVIPSVNILDDGVIAINNNKDKEKIFFKGDDGTSVISFDPTKKIMELVDQKINDTDIGELQKQIDIINGSDNVNGSFSNADKILENKLTPLISNKIEKISGNKGVKVTQSLDTNNNKIVAIEAIVKSSDLVLSIDDVSGITSTIKMNISGNTISLLGKNDTVISTIVIPVQVNFTFTSTDGINLVDTNGDVTANLKVDPNPNNRLELSNAGIFNSKIINCGNY